MDESSEITEARKKGIIGNVQGIEIAEESDVLREGLRNDPAFSGLPRLLLDRLIEGLDAMEVKTSSYQGAIVKSEQFVDYPVRLNYIKFMCVLGKFCSTESLDNLSPSKSELTREQLEKRAESLQKILGIGVSAGSDAGTGTDAGRTQAKKRTK